ncbi:hypothetical protein H9X57_00385 [Flavobacterium piscinae]|uniref:hypothetical protein n=1 Tax=Flavobacterium piscinae TaxID=2506424 RepID=UPI0019B3891C|nr:hypothetical protein [Flavobacterium piscinae]MBC8882436.1 hypothetical protein [Flavobacterium piscinae]
MKNPTPRANNDGTGIIYNGIEVITSTTLLNEGESVTISFETDTPVAETVNFTLNLNNGTFSTDDYSGTISITIPIGTSSASTIIEILNDGLNDGDEEMSIVVETLPEGYITLNNNVKVRVLDVNFEVAEWGTPLTPTYGNVSSTAPAGYYASLEGLSGNALKQAIQDIIANPEVVRAHSYGDVVEILNNADQNPANNNQVWLMYVERPQTKIDYQTGASIVGFGIENIFFRNHVVVFREALPRFRME